MADFLLTWKIDIDADTPEEAVAQALAIQRDPYSSALHFTVLNKETNEETEIEGEELIEDDEYTTYLCDECGRELNAEDYQNGAGLCPICIDEIN
jgi:formylmethanofuran dehydrogenase subunit E